MRQSIFDREDVSYETITYRMRPTQLSEVVGQSISWDQDKLLTE